MSLPDSAEIEGYADFDLAKSTTTDASYVGMNVFDDSLFEHNVDLPPSQNICNATFREAADFRSTNEDNSKSWLCEDPSPLAGFYQRPSDYKI